MFSSSIISQSTPKAQHEKVPETLKSPEPFIEPNSFIGPGVFDAISYTETDFRSNAAKASRIKGNGILQKLEEMTIQKSPQSSRVPARQKKPSVTPYYRKPKFVRVRTPEEPRRHRRQNNCSMTPETKERVDVGKATK